MKLTRDSLPNHLSKKLLPVYLISSDETILCDDAQSAIVHAAVAQSFTPSTPRHVDQNFAWPNFIADLQTIGLFSRNQVYILKFKSAPDKEAVKQLLNYLKNVNPAQILIIVTPKLNRTQENSEWYKKIDQVGCVLMLAPLADQVLIRWLQARAEQVKLKLNTEAAAMLAEQYPNNLAALAQEIEKLALLYAPATLTAEQVAHGDAECGRYTIYDFARYALNGNKSKVLATLHYLRAEKTELTLLLWVITQEIRELFFLLHRPAQQTSADFFRTRKIWPTRQTPLQLASKRHTPASSTAMLQQASTVDHIIKGAYAAPSLDAWQSLTQLALQLTDREFGGSRIPFILCPP